MTNFHFPSRFRGEAPGCKGCLFWSVSDGNCPCANIDACPWPQYSTEIKAFVDSMFHRRLIDKKTRKFLILRQPQVARFYLLPKIHKPGNPGRPIVASNGAPTENISRFVDFFLQPNVVHLQSYIRDTTDFINKLRRLPILPQDCLLVTLDVSSLYTNIPHEEGIKACEEFLNQWESQVPPTVDHSQLIQLVNPNQELIYFQ